MNEQCKSCVHKDVCAYKAHYKHAIEIYEKTKNECGEYPYFVCDIRCIKYCEAGMSASCTNEKTERFGIMYQY